MSDFEEVHAAAKSDTKEITNPLNPQNAPGNSSSAKEVLAQSQFLKRHVSNVAYQPLSIEAKLELDALNGKKRDRNPYNKTYFDADGNEDVTVLGEIGTLSISAGTSKPDAEVEHYDLPVDDAEARMARVDHFQQQARDQLSSLEGYDDHERVLFNGETVISTIECSEISGVNPNSTSESTTTGCIKVSLVHSEKFGYRLFFTIGEGSTEVGVHESFAEAVTETSCVCCCIKVRQPNGELTTNTVRSSMGAQYSHVKLFNAQFFTLPVDPCVIDAMATRVSAHELEARAGKVGSNDNCCKLQFCVDLECICTCCDGCDDCKIPVCCGLMSTLARKSVVFDAEEKWELGYKKPERKHKPLAGWPSEEKEGVSFSITRDDMHRSKVVLHYINVLDVRTRTVQLTIRPTDKPEADYQVAMSFVSTLLHQMGSKQTSGLLDRLAQSVTLKFDNQGKAIRPTHGGGGVGAEGIAAAAGIAGFCVGLGFNMGKTCGGVFGEKVADSCGTKLGNVAASCVLGCTPCGGAYNACSTVCCCGACCGK